jgi:hypothetical protein
MALLYRTGGLLTLVEKQVLRCAQDDNASECYSLKSKGPAWPPSLYLDISHGPKLEL